MLGDGPSTIRLIVERVQASATPTAVVWLHFVLSHTDHTSMIPSSLSPLVTLGTRWLAPRRGSDVGLRSATFMRGRRIEVLQRPRSPLRMGSRSAALLIVLQASNNERWTMQVRETKSYTELAAHGRFSHLNGRHDGVSHTVGDRWLIVHPRYWAGHVIHPAAPTICCRSCAATMFPSPARKCGQISSILGPCSLPIPGRRSSSIIHDPRLLLRTSHPSVCTHSCSSISSSPSFSSDTLAAAS